MSENNTVTITIDEYFELRTKAEINAMLMKELGEMRGALGDMDRRIYELSTEVGLLKRGRQNAD